MCSSSVSSSSVSGSSVSISSSIGVVCGRDAAWEMENDAFTDLLERHSCCDVSVCRCPEGRSANLLDTLVSTLQIL